MSTVAVPPLSILELDQLDIFGRLQADAYFQAGVPVLLELKGITENDVLQKLSVVNQQNKVVGSCVVVLMPTLVNESPNAPGPRYDAIYEIQVIDAPIMRRQIFGGNQSSADEVADRIRQIIHRFTMGRGQTVVFSGQRRTDVPNGNVSYILRFKRVGVDQPPTQVAGVLIALSASTEIMTMTCLTPGAAIYYTVDGSYPSSIATGATKYTGPFTPPAGSTIRAAAEAPGYQQSNVISSVSLAGDFSILDFGTNFSLTK